MTILFPFYKTLSLPPEDMFQNEYCESTFCQSALGDNHAHPVKQRAKQNLAQMLMIGASAKAKLLRVGCVTTGELLLPNDLS